VRNSSDRPGFTIAATPAQKNGNSLRRTWFQTIKKPLFSKDGQVCQVLGVSTDITEQKLAKELLQRSEEQLQLALNAAHMGNWDWNIQTGKFTWSNNLKQLYGLPPNAEDTYETFLASVHPEDRDYINQANQRAFEKGEDCHLKFRVIWSDGSIHWIESKGQIFFDEIGQPIRMTGIDLDITQRKQAEAQIKESLREKEVLLQEIHHRVKNNLQVISSLLDLQSLHIKEPKMLEMFRDSCNRVKSMALVHENLYQSKNYAKVNFREYIESLMMNLFQVYGVKGDRMTLEQEIDIVALNIDTAIPCGLIINELVSNALKHAFPDKNPGLISILFKVNKEQHYTLIVRDNGKGLPSCFNINSLNTLGLQLVDILRSFLSGS